MTEQRELRGFGRFNEPVAPDRAFADALYAQLSAELGFETSAQPAAQPSAQPVPTPAARRNRRPALRLPRAIRTLRWPAPTMARRFAYVALVVGLLFAVTFATLLAAGVIGKPDPRDLVRQSRAAEANPPAFAMSLRMPDGQVLSWSYDGAGTWRTDLPPQGPDDKPGSYNLFDGKRFGDYVANGNTWQILTVPDQIGGPPMPLGGEFAWRRWDEKLQATVDVPCEQASYLGEDPVAGRPADVVACADLDMRFWIDKETRLVLRFQAGPETPNWGVGGSDMKPVIEATSLSVGPQDAALFAWTGPAGAFDPNNMPPSTLFSVGDPAPELSGTAIDGSPWTTAAGKPTAVLFKSGGTGRTTDEALASVLRDQPGLAGIVIDVTTPGTAAGIRSVHPSTATTTADPDGALMRGWGISYYSTLVLLDAGGVVRAVHPGSVTEADMRAMVAALFAGAPIPSPAPPPESTPFPMPEDPILGGDAPLTTWTRGSNPGAWSMPLLGDGTVDSASLAGKPVFVYFWMPYAGAPEDDLRHFGELAAAMGDEARFLVIAEGEPTTGFVAETVKRLGVTVPVAFDWDGTWSSQFRMNGEAILLVDGEGRLVDGSQHTPDAVGAREMLAKLATGGG